MKVAVVDAGRVNFSSLTRPSEVSPKDWVLIESCYVRSDERWIGLANGQVACMWGLIPPTILSWSAYIWLYHNALVEQHKFLFVRHSQLQIKEMLKKYPNIVGDCLASNHTGRKWLEWLGARFEKSSGLMIRFTIRATNG